MAIVMAAFIPVIVIFTLGHIYSAHKTIVNFNSLLMGEQFEAVEGQFPYSVSIRNASLFHRCGGSIIATKWILTAAHCVINYSPSSFWVVVGSVDLDKGGDYHQVSTIICHENYVLRSYANDIAVLHLASPLVFGPGIQPIELENRNLDAYSCIMSGWNSSRLRFTELKLINNSACQSRYKKIPIIESQICTISGFRVVHGGDSGNPLVVNGKQIGIVSWGYPYEHLPVVHTKVSAFYEWIQSVTGLSFSTNISQQSDVRSYSVNHFCQFHRNNLILLLLLIFIF